MFDGYWPWWLGSLALTAVALGYWRAVGRTFGVSGVWTRIVFWRQERSIDEDEAEFTDLDDFEAALMAATMAELAGDDEDTAENTDDTADDSADDAGDPDSASASHDEPLSGFDPVPSTPLITDLPARPSVSAGLVFLLAVFAGGFLSSLVSGTSGIKYDFGPEFVSFFGSNWSAWAVLAGGGFLVGLGTNMAGGCTSGHGLNGCASRQPGSLLSTAAFFATGIVVATLLGMVHG